MGLAKAGRSAGGSMDGPINRDSCADLGVKKGAP